MTLSTHNEKKIALTAQIKYNIKCQVLFYIWVDLLVILEREAVILYFYIICWCGFNIIRYKSVFGPVKNQIFLPYIM